MARRLRFLILLLLLAAALCVASAASAVTMRPGLSGVPYAVVSDAAAKAARQTPICPNGAVCYSPSHLRDAYDFPNGQGAATGAGQTIIVVTAYGSTTIEADLAQFDAENGLPSPPSFTIVEQQTPVPGAQGTGDLLHWQVETSLDVEYAHAMARGAAIVLAVAASDDTRDLRQVQLEVLPKYPGSIVSESFGLDEDILFGGEPETPAALDALYLAHVQGGGTIVASSGDLGASGLGGLFGLARPIAGYPASSPFVLGVGGTMGSPFPQGLWNAGRYGGEQAWNELISISPGAGAGGGAPSIVYPAPPWQVGLTHSSMRAEPDVSYNAAFDGGEVIVVTTPFGRHAVIGGTSAGAPQWAAIVALANELRGRQGRPPLGLATPQLWLLAEDRNAYRQDFHDITTGSNALGGPDSGLPGFDAGPGYDYATGLGTPDVARLVKDLAGRDSVHLRLDDLLGPKQH